MNILKDNDIAEGINIKSKRMSKTIENLEINKSNMDSVKNIREVNRNKVDKNKVDDLIEEKIKSQVEINKKVSEKNIDLNGDKIPDYQNQQDFEIKVLKKNRDIKIKKKKKIKEEESERELER
ncbi:MAG: hypothetical protein KGV57_04680 [Fusobacterium sp.]|nr:hypothetical protein [Fusobacterium sp.]